MKPDRDRTLARAADKWTVWQFSIARHGRVPVYFWVVTVGLHTLVGFLYGLQRLLYNLQRWLGWLFDWLIVMLHG